MLFTIRFTLVIIPSFIHIDMALLKYVYPHRVDKRVSIVDNNVDNNHDDFIILWKHVRYAHH